MLYNVTLEVRSEVTFEVEASSKLEAAARARVLARVEGGSAPVIIVDTQVLSCDPK